MFRHKLFLLSLILGLSLLPQTLTLSNTVFDTSITLETITAEDDDLQPIDITYDKWINSSFELIDSSEVLFTNPFLIQSVSHNFYAPIYLQYLSIGNRIELNFSSTAIIFPFHVFT